MIDEALCLVRASAGSAEEVIKLLAQRLLEKGHVKPGFEKAALAREKRSPTGLPFPNQAIALPHAEPEHVLSPAIAVATLVAPVTFRQMGSPETKLNVSIIVMPAFSAKEQAGAGLTTLIEKLQDESLRQKLLAAQSSNDLARLL